MVDQTTPRRAPVGPLGNLAVDLDVSRQAIYVADDKGYIGGTIRTGKHRKIRNEARAYHAEHGYGPGVPPWGSPESRAYDAERGYRAQTADAAA
jgi:hypothetical protein